ncbi:DUF6301 family protein [Nocardia terpenica]|uniref:Uncharacterized protein n=1 Tax=Nocardia terpenica TaxID=455432 RepID=A0A291RCX6_9NOCA|nr:DUF6301 family protein [Nocardia terpenica]ATL65168.1 hypothetical protein CRH09_01885 [Nocardia terpenica]
MTESLKFDAEGAAAVVHAATTFDWSWNVGDIERFGSALGWKPDDFGNESTVFMTTRMQIDQPDAWFNLTGEAIDDVTFNVSDSVNSSKQELLDDAFVAIEERLSEVLGSSTRSSGRRPGLAWEGGPFVGRLVQLDEGITMSLIRPEYQRISDEHEARGLRSKCCRSAFDY